MKKPIFLFVVLCLSLSACNSGKDSSNSGNRTPDNPTPPEPRGLGAPTDLVATSGDRQVTLGWKAPSDTGDSAITHYEYQYGTASGTFDQTWTNVSGDENTTTISDLTGATTYFFRVRAVNTQGPGGPSTEVEAVAYDGLTPEPGVPPTLTATPGDRRVTLSWETPSIGASAITHYEYQYRTETSDTFSQTWIKVSGDGKTKTVSGLTKAVTYFFRVRAVNTQGPGSPSTVVDATPYDESTFQPGAPRDLKAIPGDRQVTLNWKVPSTIGTSEITHYEYQYRTTSGTFDQTWTQVSGDGNTTIVSSLTGATTYFFRVRAVNAQGGGSPTQVSVTPYDGPTPEPGAPTNLMATSGNRQVTLSWEASSFGASAILRYEYQYRTTGTFGQIWTEVPNWESALEIIIPNLAGATTYFFRVRAVNTQGPGSPSTETEAIAYDGSTPEPGAPTNLTATPGDRQVTLNWNAPQVVGASAITHYEYQQRTTGAFDDIWINVPGDGNTAAVSGLTEATTYFFRVRAVNAQGPGSALHRNGGHRLRWTHP